MSNIDKGKHISLFNPSDDDVFKMMTAVTDETFDIIDKFQLSPAGKKQVEQYKGEQHKKDVYEFWRRFDAYNQHKEVLDNWDSTRPPSGPRAREAWEIGAKISLDELKDMGFVGFQKRDDGLPDDIIVKDMNVAYAEGPAKGFVNKEGRIIMPEKPKDKIGQMKWESTYQHELGHQRRRFSGGYKSMKGSLWHEREEEQAAMRDQVAHLKSEFKRANLPYRPIDAGRLMTGNGENEKLKAMPNPSMVSRMRFLPTGEEASGDIGKNLKDLWDAKWTMARSGLDIRYGDNELSNIENIGRVAKKWEIANE